MHTTPTQSESGTEAAPPSPASRGRISLIVLFILLLVMVLIVVLPPLVNVSRFQKRIANNISTALGRPVHFDHVSLTLLPMPGFTLENFTVDEDPAFGYEPVLYADQVDVTLRLSSLWHPHVEFSKISFTEPSVNLVRSNGRWNIESLLLQASHLEVAPTAQPHAGPARRFPYIEATGARLNLKFDQEKSPVSLTDTDFALWLPEPHQWHLRLEAHPVRTDSSPGDTGTIRAEGTLGGTDLNAASLAGIPIDLQGDWRDAQLGGISRLMLGRDPGVRGDFALTFTLRGTVGQNNITTGIKLAKARRADFVPDTMLSLEASCQATAVDTFRSFTAIACRWPPSSSSDPAVLAVTGNLPDVRNLDSATASLNLPSLPADTFFSWLSVATPRPPAVLAGAGTLTGNLAWGRPADTPSTAPGLTGEISFSGGSLSLDSAANHSLTLGDVVLSSQPTLTRPAAHSRHGVRAPAAEPNSFDLQPLSLDLGGTQPATLQGHFDANGYTLRLTGPAMVATLRQMAIAAPQFGDGIAPLLDALAPPLPSGAPPAPSLPIRVDLTAIRAWGGPQTWTQAAAPAPKHPRRR
jgi:AsmA family